MHRIEQVEHAAAERQHRKGADAARTPGVGAGKEILEGEAQKQAQCQQQRDARHRRRRDHGLDQNLAVARWAGVSYISRGATARAAGSGGADALYCAAKAALIGEGHELAT